jgi:hypothetical protein
MGYDLIGQQCVLNSRHTDCIDKNIGPKKSVCIVSSILGKGLHINTLISRGRKTWAGDGCRAWRGGVARKPRPVLDFNGKFMCRSARDGRFQQWLQPGGRGLMHAVLPPPWTDRWSFAQNACKKQLAGSSDTPPYAARVPAPPCTKSVKQTEILRRTFSFSYTRVRQCSPIGYMIG